MSDSIRDILAETIHNTMFDGKVYFAGGCVRDKILGRKTSDIDLAVELPNGGILLAEYLFELGISTKPMIYQQFGTALVRIGKQKIELVMTRRESYRNRSRKPEVAFGSLQEDVQRRDFTVNSLLQNVSDGSILDLSGKGLADLQSGVIRATSRPEVIFSEDPLRLLRAVRFAVELGFRIERRTLTQIRRQALEVQRISHERILGELLRIFKHPDYLKGIRILIQTGLKNYIFPGLRISALFRRPLPDILDIDNTAEVKSALEKLTWHARMALFLFKSGNSLFYLRQLKLPLNDRKQIFQLICVSREIRYKEGHSLLQTEGQLLKTAHYSGLIIDELMNVYPLIGLFYHWGRSDWEQDCQICQKIKASLHKIESYRFNLTGDDLIRTFCTTGSETGHWLLLARDYWYEHPLAEKEELLEHIRSKRAEKRSKKKVKDA